MYSYKFFRSPDLSWKREDPYTASKKSFFPDGNKEQLRIVHFDEFEVIPKRVQHLETLAIGNQDRFPNFHSLLLQISPHRVKIFNDATATEQNVRAGFMLIQEKGASKLM